MARFPYYKSNVAALGKLLAEARTNSALRHKLINDPQGELTKIGLPENVTTLLNFKVVDNKGKKSAVVPFRLDQTKLEANDPLYLQKISDSFLRPN